MKMVATYFLVLMICSSISGSEGVPLEWFRQVQEKARQARAELCNTEGFSEMCLLPYMQPWGEVGNFIFQEFKGLAVAFGSDLAKFDEMPANPNNPPSKQGERPEYIGGSGHNVRNKRQAGGPPPPGAPQQPPSFMYANFHMFMANTFLSMNFTEGCKLVKQQDKIKTCMDTQLTGCPDMYKVIINDLLGEILTKMTPYCQPGCNKFAEDAATVDVCLVPLVGMIQKFGNQEPKGNQLKRYCNLMIAQMPCFNAIDSTCENIQLGRVGTFIQALAKGNESCAEANYHIVYNNPNNQKFLMKNVMTTTAENDEVTSSAAMPAENDKVTPSVLSAENEDLTTSSMVNTAENDRSNDNGVMTGSPLQSSNDKNSTTGSLSPKVATEEDKSEKSGSPANELDDPQKDGIPGIAEQATEDYGSGDDEEDTTHGSSMSSSVTLLPNDGDTTEAPEYHEEYEEPTTDLPDIIGKNDDEGSGELESVTVLR